MSIEKSLLLCLLATPVSAQTGPPAGSAAPPETAEASETARVVVTGKRASLRSAQAIKRGSTEIVDAVVAEDIDKLPDFSVGEALQRVTGVQIARDRGEASVAAIRGLTQIETTLNGREVFTAGTGRNLDWADFPAEMISAIDVYKSASAERIEGGVGGSVDLRTRRPFDFAGREIAGSLRVVHGSLVRKNATQLSALLSDRWRLRGAGEFGALLSLVHQDRAWREDQKGSGVPTGRTDLIAGRTIVAPNSTSETTSAGERRRSAADLALQWRASPALELYAQASVAELRTRQDSQQINVSASPSFVPGSLQLFDGSSDLRSITWVNAPISILSFARDTLDRTRQIAAGGSWQASPLTLKADLSHTRSVNRLFFSGPFFAGTAATFTQDLSSDVPGTSVGGTNLLDPANFRYTGIAYRSRPFDGELSTARIDGDLQLGSGFVHTLSAGLRQAQRRAGNAPGLIFADAPLSGLSAADRPGEVMPNPYNDFFPGEGAPSLRNFIVGNLADARDAAGLRAAFGITTPIPTAGSPLGLWHIGERTDAGYLMARFAAESLPLDGNLGLRVVRTREAVSGQRSLPDSGGVAPIHVDSAYTDALPSLNLRSELAGGWVLRAAASKTITRPNFDQLSPSLTLLRNSVDPTLNQGSAGNPQLEPVRADNVDLALERYLGPTTSLHATLFWKKVDGFVVSSSAPEVVDGVTYQVSRPRNSADARIQGLELGYQQFYDGLPGWLGGLGLQANATYVDSRTRDSVLGAEVPLQNLSRRSANLVGMYEQGRLSARIGYNWRDKFLSGVTSVVGVGALPVFTRGYGWLDASLTYRIDERVSFAIVGTNLLGTMRKSYYGVPTRPQSNLINDVQLGATLSLRLP
jgi:iron complex outermembrane receptor protein